MITLLCRPDDSSVVRDWQRENLKEPRTGRMVAQISLEVSPPGLRDVLGLCVGIIMGVGCGSSFDPSMVSMGELLEK